MRLIFFTAELVISLHRVCLVTHRLFAWHAMVSKGSVTVMDKACKLKSCLALSPIFIGILAVVDLMVDDFVFIWHLSTMLFIVLAVNYIGCVI